MRALYSLYKLVQVKYYCVKFFRHLRKNKKKIFKNEKFANYGYYLKSLPVLKSESNIAFFPTQYLW